MKVLKVSLALFLALPLFLFAQEIINDTSAYRSIKAVISPKIVVPTVVNVPFAETDLERLEFLVFDKTNKTFLPSLFMMSAGEQDIKIDVSGSEVVSAQNVYSLNDNNEETYYEFPVSGDTVGSAQIVVTGAKEMSTNSLYLLLDSYVALPKTINIVAESNGVEKVVLATQKVESQTVNFPQTKFKKLVVNLTYGQPLRITEIRLGGANYAGRSYDLRFLAKPGSEYEIYFNPDRRVLSQVGETPNLADNKDVIRVSSGQVKLNSAYVEADVDKDGIPDSRDNCVSVSNADQTDINSNGRGDVCDDFDKDGVLNSLDNCPNDPNSNQLDNDGDKIGDICDPDESRVTEKYPWLPWLGIIGAFIIVIGLFSWTVFFVKKEDQIPPQN